MIIPRETKGGKVPNWNKIDRCGVWKVLGVIECANCDSRDVCWGDDAKCVVECQFCPTKCNLREERHEELS